MPDTGPEGKVSVWQPRRLAGAAPAMMAGTGVPRSLEGVMLMIRELMYCKPGKVRPMAMDSSPEMKEIEPLMKGYHDLVDHGRREIYKIEG